MYVAQAQSTYTSSCMYHLGVEMWSQTKQTHRQGGRGAGAGRRRVPGKSLRSVESVDLQDAEVNVMLGSYTRRGYVDRMWCGTNILC